MRIKKQQINHRDFSSAKNDIQTIATTFIENQYSLKQNSIITTGVQYSKVKNNHSVQNDNLFLYRLGHTYTTQNLTMKTIASHTEMTLEPYLINSIMFLATPNFPLNISSKFILYVAQPFLTPTPD